MAGDCCALVNHQDWHVSHVDEVVLSDELAAWIPDKVRYCMCAALLTTLSVHRIEVA